MTNLGAEKREPGSVFRRDADRTEALSSGGFFFLTICMVVWFVQGHKLKRARRGLVGAALCSQRTRVSFCSRWNFQFLLLRSWDPQRFSWLPLQELAACMLSPHVPALLSSVQPSCPVHCSVSSCCQAGLSSSLLSSCPENRSLLLLREDG